MTTFLYQSSFILLCLVVPSSSWACATCSVGDPSLTVMGTEKNFVGRWRFSTDTLYRTETIGVENVNQREVTELRATSGISYAPVENWVLGLQIPIVRKTLEDVNLSQTEQTAMGDIVVSAKKFIYQDRPTQPRHLAGGLMSLRIPTGQEQTADNGEPLDIDVQPGAGNWVPSLGGWYGYYRFPWFGYFSTTLNYPLGEGYAEFEEGIALLTTALLQYAPNYRVALQLGFDTRWSERHRFAGVTDEDSGGFSGFLSPGLVVNLADDLLIYATVQVPVIEQLHGEHEEDMVFRLGLTYDLNWH